MLDYTDDELYAMLKDLPDFKSYPLPSSWYKKYNIPPVEVIEPREYIASNYAFKCAFAHKDLPPILINKPQTDKEGKVKVVELKPFEDIGLEVKSRPFELKEGEMFPMVLPSLLELPTDASSPAVHPSPNCSSSSE